MRAILLCFVLPLPLALAILLFKGLDRPIIRPAPASGLVAGAQISRGNSAGDFHVSAQGIVIGTRPVFDQVSVTFQKPSGRGLHVNASNLTFHPFANSIRSTDYRPVTPAALLNHFASIGCDRNSLGTAELADALDKDLRNVAAGTVPAEHLYIGPYHPPPDDEWITPAKLVIGWLLLSGLAATAVLIKSRRWSGAPP